MTDQPSAEALLQLLREDVEERRMFDASTIAIHDGSALHAVADALAIWHKMAPEVGSYGKSLAIYSNEVRKAAFAAQAMAASRQPNAELGSLIDFMIYACHDLVDARAAPEPCFYYQCKLCHGTDRDREALHIRPTIAEVVHADECLLGRYRSKLRHLGTASERTEDVDNLERQDTPAEISLSILLPITDKGKIIDDVDAVELHHKIRDAIAAALAEACRAEREHWAKEACIGWSVCASIHREYAKGKDALFSTRQADFVKHETDARRALAEARRACERAGCERFADLYALMDIADEALNKETEDQKRLYEYDAPDDCDWIVTAGTCRKIDKVFAEIDRLRCALTPEVEGRS